MTAFAAVEGLTLRHIGRRTPALRELSLRWEAGERLLLLGPSGSGKSTLTLCLNGLIPQAIDAHWESGRVVVGGRETRDTPLAELTARVGLVFQDPEAQLVMLEVDDEIAFGLENRGIAPQEMEDRIAEARSLVGLGAATPRWVSHLSGGTKQRLAIAGVLAARPDGVVLDEPTANLDPRGAAAVMASIARLCADRSRSILLVEHRVDDAILLADRVAVLDERGSCALSGTPAELFGAQRERVAALGAHTPELADLAGLLGIDVLPATASDAARLLVGHWPDRTVSVRRPPPGVPLLRGEGLRYRYRAASTDAVAVSELEVRGGEVLALVGANGAGKTTLGMLIAGVLAPHAGRVTLRGADLRDLPGHDRRAQIAYVFQYPEHQFVAPTVRDELRYGLRVRGVRSAEKARRADLLLARFGLTALAEASPHTLSHGEKRRLSVATALVTEPEVLVLDEPTFGQDRRMRAALVADLRGLAAQGRGVVIITHDLSLVADEADRAVALSRGQVVFDGPPAMLFDRPELLARCGLAVPPAAHAIRIAALARPELAAARGLADLRRTLRSEG